MLTTWVLLDVKFQEHPLRAETTNPLVSLYPRLLGSATLEPAQAFPLVGGVVVGGVVPPPSMGGVPVVGGVGGGEAGAPQANVAVLSSRSAGLVEVVEPELLKAMICQ